MPSFYTTDASATYRALAICAVSRRTPKLDRAHLLTAARRLAADEAIRLADGADSPGLVGGFEARLRLQARADRWTLRVAAMLRLENRAMIEMSA